MSSKKLAQSVSSVCDFRPDRDIAPTDAEIDNPVYELYGITDEERKIIEGARWGRHLLVPPPAGVEAVPQSGAATGILAR